MIRKKLIQVLVVAVSIGMVLPVFAADSSTQTTPPVAQSLVREGDFALELAATLDLGTPTDEAVAEDILTKAGVAPLNGWLSDYPVTPEILGQLQEAIAQAAADGKLSMTSEQATKGLYYLASQMNLPVPAGSASQNGEPVRSGESSQSVVNNYYYDSGPPIVTYYRPPEEYLYLYAWVPYPVFWYGFWFPGFFICHDFTTVVVVGHGGFGHHHHGGKHERRAIVSNRVIDPVTHTVARVHPVVKTEGGHVRPITTIRTEGGRSFKNLHEVRREGGSSGGFNGSRHGFKNSEARSGAESILNRSAGHSYRPSSGSSAGTVNRGGEGRTFRTPDRAVTSSGSGISSESHRRSFSNQHTSGNTFSKSYTAPAAPPATQREGRSFSAPAPRPSESFSRSSMSGGGGGHRESSSRGWQGNSGRGGSSHGQASAGGCSGRRC